MSLSATTAPIHEISIPRAVRAIPPPPHRSVRFQPRELDRFVDVNAKVQVFALIQRISVEREPVARSLFLRQVRPIAIRAW